MTLGNSKVSSSTYIKGHKRQQASIGLGIVTDLIDIPQPHRDRVSKNDTFFDTSACLQPKPPPSIVIHSSKPVKADESKTLSQQNVLYRNSRNFTDRIRCIVQNNQHCIKHPFVDENIIPLPSPEQPQHSFSKHPIRPSVDEPPTSAIPIISLSPNFNNKNNIIPSLMEVPMLGDIDESTITREYIFRSPPSASVFQGEVMIGKHIWKLRIKRLLGVGAFSKVYLADNMQVEGQSFAVKMINKEKMIQDPRVRSSIEREIGVLKFLNHEHIVQLEATMETEQYLCIVLEYVKGEELFDFVQKMHLDLHKEGQSRSIDEKLVKRLSLELIQVVSWLHDHNIVHRDLKLENILVYYHKGEAHLKLTDFGLARVMNPDSPKLTTRCGSEEYAAPEIVQNTGYDGRLTDTWAIGIVIYALLVGYLPFSLSKGEKTSHLFHRIVMAQVKWPPHDQISQEAKEVVESMLKRQAEKRIKLKDVYKLPWFNVQ